jgi:hypothetical protein
MSDEQEETALVAADIHDVAVAVSTPINQIESSLSSYLQDTFKIALEYDAFQKALQAETLTRLPHLSDTQVVALLTSSQTNFNDYISKTVAPTTQLLTAAQQAELAARREQQVNNVAQVNTQVLSQNASTDVLVGMKSLMDIMASLSTKRAGD